MRRFSFAFAVLSLGAALLLPSHLRTARADEPAGEPAPDASARAVLERAREALRALEAKVADLERQAAAREKARRDAKERAKAEAKEAAERKEAAEEAAKTERVEIVIDDGNGSDPADIAALLREGLRVFMEESAASGVMPRGRGAAPDDAQRRAATLRELVRQGIRAWTAAQGATPRAEVPLVPTPPPPAAPGELRELREAVAGLREDVRSLRDEVRELRKALQETSRR
jgi:membrane protein involved in colicin uptake